MRAEDGGKTSFCSGVTNVLSEREIRQSGQWIFMESVLSIMETVNKKPVLC